MGKEDKENIFFRIIKKFDGFGASVNLQVNGDKDDKNIIGAILSILLFSISISLSYSTFERFFNATHPTITTNIEYSTHNLTINHENFYFALSFFKPFKETRSIDSKANDLAAMKFINQLKISCLSCDEDYLNSNKLMNLCNPDQFNDLVVKSMSVSQSKDIKSIFSSYSFCFPEEIESVVKDNTDDSISQDSSLDVFIPINNLSVEFTNVQKNIEAQPGKDVLIAKLSGSDTASTIENKRKLHIAPSTIDTLNAQQSQQPGSGIHKIQLSNNGMNQTSGRGKNLIKIFTLNRFFFSNFLNCFIFKIL